LIVIFLMFAGMPGLKMIVSERSCGITRRFMSTPVKMRHIILSKFLVSIILSIIQFAIIIILTSFIFKNYWGTSLKNILLLFGGIIFAVSAWSIFVSSISRTPASADVIGNLGILLMAVIGGSIYPLSSMPGFVRSMSNLTINKWAMDGFMVIFSGNEGLNVLNQTYVLLIIGVVMLSVSVGIMRLTKK
jgi:ABC-2 type transport system permease protein